MSNAVSWLPLVLRAGVVGILGGAGLVLTQLYSRRGPLIYPVYAALLAALALVSSRFQTLPYVAHFAAVLTGMLVATGMTLVAVLVLGGRERRRLLESGRPVAHGRAPLWGLPLILFAIVAASAGAAFVAS